MSAMNPGPSTSPGVVPQSLDITIEIDYKKLTTTFMVINHGVPQGVLEQALKDMQEKIVFQNGTLIEATSGGDGVTIHHNRAHYGPTILYRDGITYP